MPTPVTGRCNVHSAATYRQPLGVRCPSSSVACWCRSTSSATHGSDMTPLHTLPLKCAACGGREVELWLFVKRDEAEAWAER